MTTTVSPGHCARFRALTHDTHDVLDKRIMAYSPFSGRERYAAFLKVQYCFHRDVAALFDNTSLNTLLPGLKERGRFAAVAQDLKDLGQALPEPEMPPVFGEQIDLPTAIGWLYVEEGSNLGGAILFKMAGKLDLSADFGARHLAPHPEGRAPSWRAFMQQLDAIELDDKEQQRANNGAEAAFTQVLSYVERYCPIS
ncbi:biliverdin-producing heme oxygenase [Spongiibacter tropicus]|uniref:biliverdin-producing heme oxygenase n=2 Tax=Spongiibacter TaxID=630749 RepID=UPI0003B5CD1B|nr:biliverdin-producing heme oxygenase [Spongiibacter tropicus]